jgi:glycosyltransferase involved in cell wall biosynthesis
MSPTKMPRNIFKYLFYRVTAFIRYILETASPSKISDYHDIPVIINNFNRLEYLKKLIESLEKRGYNNIYIIDNLSTYPPLLQFYNTCKYQIFRLKKNLGAYALWKSGIIKKFDKDYFVYTDADLELIEECPADFMVFFLHALQKHKLASKVGFSLKIDDIPDYFAPKRDVIAHEQTFSRFYLSDESLYYAPIDTTFALYRPRTSWKHANYNIEMYRAAYPYMARHLPWYIDSSNPDIETCYYLDTANRTAIWIGRDKDLAESRNQIKDQ